MKRIFILIQIILLSLACGGQNLSKLDSLKLVFSEEKNDTSRIMLMNRISHELQFSNIEDASVWAKRALEESGRIGFKKGRGYAITQLGNIEVTKGNLDSAEYYNKKALGIVTDINDPTGCAICYNNLGIIAHSRNDYSIALEYYRKSLAINKRIGRKEGEATSLFCIGTLFENLQKNDSALIYYYKAQDISESIGIERLMAYAKTSLANVYYSMENYHKSLEFNEEAIKLYERSKNDYGLLKVYLSLGQTSLRLDRDKEALWFYRQALKTGLRVQSRGDVANALFSMGQIFEKEGKIDSAVVSYKNANELFVEAGNRENEAVSLIALARMSNIKGNPSEAMRLLPEALKIAGEIQSPSALTGSYQQLALTASYLKDYKSAFTWLNKYSDATDSIMNTEKQGQILKLQTQYETERKEKENELLRKDQQILKSSRNSLIIGALLLVIIAVVILRSLSIKKRDNRLLREQKQEIARQKDIVEDQKASITDSIRYAKRIQSAMLPPGELVNEAIPDSFILYLPRDIVSGDFYWMKKLDSTRVLACVADCTGHGVPGAFMSMLGMSLLSDIINRNLGQILDGSFSSGKILESMRERIKESLRQTGKEGESRDGMDMALCIINTDSGKIMYSGAINSLYHVTEGVLTEIKATRNPVGIYPNEMSFIDNEVTVPQGTMVYMFSDGYFDQIGADGGKFLSKNFKKLLAGASHLPAADIKTMLVEKHLEWRKDEEQVDDILVMGIRV
jgi:serine phosphatase RsbU (regulator of sigma subunit)